MGLIINNKIQELLKGFPTVSDKYNVLPAVLDGTAPVGFGDVVVYSSTAGYYTKPTTITAAAQVAGFVVATNVKVPENYPGTVVQVNPGEAFNLLHSGYIAVAVDAGATDSNIAAGKKVAVLPNGKITTSGTATAIDLDGVVFTGTKETVGGVKLAEIYKAC